MQEMMNMFARLFLKRQKSRDENELATIFITDSLFQSVFKLFFVIYDSKPNIFGVFNS